MSYVATAILILAACVLLAARMLSNAIIEMTNALGSRSLIDRRDDLVGGIPDGPGATCRTGAIPSLDDMGDARLEIQMRAFDSPPLFVVGGDIPETMGNDDVMQITDGINREFRS